MDLQFAPNDYDHPKSGNAVRGTCDLLGTVFRKLRDKKTSIVMYTRSDPDLKLLPQAFIEKGARDSGYTIKYFIDYMDKSSQK